MPVHIPTTQSWFRHLKNKWFIAGAIIVIILVIYLMTRGGSVSSIESAVVSRGNVLEKVSVTGKISSIDKADLAFEKSGTLLSINVKIGDHMNRGAVIASLNNADAEASLVSAQAKLDDMTRSLRPEELQVEQARVDTANVALTNARTDAVNAVRDSYVKAQGAVVNYVDVFFTNPQSANPVLKVTAQSNITQTSIQQERIGLTDILNNWKNDLDAASSTQSIKSLISQTHSYLSGIKSFMDDLSSIVNYLNPGNSGLSQGVIDMYTSNMNLALSGLNQAVSSIAMADTTLQQAMANYDEAQSNFILKNSGSSTESIRSQQATVDSLVATVSKGRIVSPIDGIVTRVDPTVGEFVPAGQTIFTVMSDGAYKIEAFVPEADIAKVAIGNHASVTLDAYGSNTFFNATVSTIDPAETVIEGVSTYKVTLLFDIKDDRIRSGMTANTDILTHERDNVLTVSSRAIIEATSTSAANVKAVRVLNADGNTFTTVPVEVGLKGSDGFSEIISGLTEGQKVVTYVK